MTLFLSHLFVLLSAALYSSCFFSRCLIDRLLVTAMLIWGNVVFVCLVLSSFKHLGDPIWFFRISLVLALTMYLLIRYTASNAIQLNDDTTKCEDKNHLLIGLFVLTIGPIFIANLVIAAAYLPNNYDSLTYHLPRVMYYLGQNTLAHFETENLRQIFFPFNFNLLQLFVIVYGAPLKGVTFLNIAVWVVSGLAIYRISRFCGYSFNSSLIATWLALTSTQVLAQATATTNDLPTGAAILCAVLFALYWNQTRQSRYALLAGLAAGLAVGTKLTVVFFCPAALFLALVFCYHRWRLDTADTIPSEMRVWIPSALIALIVGLPFMFYNLLGAGHWMTNAYDFTLNKPFSIECVWQTSKAYLVQLFIEPLHRFPFNLQITNALNEWINRTLFEDWNPAYAFSPLYIFPPDLNEDHVWFGFAGPFILVSAIISLIRNRKIETPVTWFSVLGIGWFAIYFVFNKWSLYIQRYFVPALLLMAPCVAATIDGWKDKGYFSHKSRNNLFIALFATSLWFAIIYMAQNTNRPLLPLLIKSIPRPAMTQLPSKMLQQLPSQQLINIITYGGNERIFLLMGTGNHQRFTSSKQIDDQKYNVLSEWGFTRNAIYSNIANKNAHTLINVPEKKTAGVEFLGTIGTDVNGWDYFGILPQAGRIAPSFDNAGILVSLNYSPKAVDRFSKTLISVAGLNIGDHAQVLLTLELEDGTYVKLATISENGQNKVSIMQPFKRIVISVIDTLTGREIGDGELPVKVMNKSDNKTDAKNTDSLFVLDFIKPGYTDTLPIDGLAEFEGPYAQWDLPIFRWAKQQSVQIRIPENNNLKRLCLSFSLRLQIRDDAELEVLHNGRLLKAIWLHGKKQWFDESITIEPVPGENILEFRDSLSGVEPDWSLYLDKYPDVKQWAVSQGIPIESAAQQHFEQKGRADGRLLEKQMNTNIATKGVSPPNSLYFAYRKLRIEGFSSP